jgi:hypothetical protein
VPFIKVRTLIAIIFFKYYILSAPFFFSYLFPRFLLRTFWYAWWCPIGLFSSVNYLSFLIISLPASIISLDYLYNFWVSLLSAQMCYWNPLLSLKFSALCFSTPGFKCGFILEFIFTYLFWGRRGLTIFPKLALICWACTILLVQPPEYLGQ